MIIILLMVHIKMQMIVKIFASHIVLLYIAWENVTNVVPQSCRYMPVLSKYNKCHVPVHASAASSEKFSLTNPQPCQPSKI